MQWRSDFDALTNKLTRAHSEQKFDAKLKAKQLKAYQKKVKAAELAIYNQGVLDKRKHWQPNAWNAGLEPGPIDDSELSYFIYGVDWLIIWILFASMNTNFVRSLS